jgi:hypothetical protein
MWTRRPVTARPSPKRFSDGKKPVTGRITMIETGPILALTKLKQRFPCSITRFLAALFVTVSMSSSLYAQYHLTIEKIPSPGLPGDGQSPVGTVEIQGLGASGFRPQLWTADTLHWVPDIRHPLLAPKMGGVFRNIYAASAVEEQWGWRLFYSAWDGTDTPFDRIYSAVTPDFVDFDARHMVIDRGDFLHVSNVSVQKVAGGSYRMLATAADEIAGPYKSTNKPVVFFSNDGETWNGSERPYQAKAKDLVAMAGYPSYDRADLNGANALLQDGSITRLYFSDWTHPGTVFLAAGNDSSHLAFQGTALRSLHAANEVRKFTVAHHDWYLMGLYKKGDVGLTASDSEHLWYSLSQNGQAFAPEQKLIDASGDLDRFIFSVGFVTRDSSLIGVVYGAGDEASDNHNQIFASWLQKRVELVARPGFNEGNGAIFSALGALGPDRQRFALPGGMAFDGTLRFYDDDGKTLMGSLSVHLEPGKVYRIGF